MQDPGDVTRGHPPRQHLLGGWHRRRAPRASGCSRRLQRFASGRTEPLRQTTQLEGDEKGYASTSHGFGTRQRVDGEARASQELRQAAANLADQPHTRERFARAGFPFFLTNLAWGFAPTNTKHKHQGWHCWFQCTSRCVLPWLTGP